MALAIAVVPSSLHAQTVLSVAGGGTGESFFSSGAILTGNGSSSLTASGWLLSGSSLVTPNSAWIADNSSGLLAMAGANGGGQINFLAGPNGAVNIYATGTGINSVSGSGEIALDVGGTITPAGGNAYGQIIRPTYGNGVQWADTLADWPSVVAGQSVTSINGIHLGNPALGTGSTLVQFAAIAVDPLFSGTTNYAFFSAGGGLVSIGDTTHSSSPATGAVIVGHNIGLGGDGSAHFAGPVALGPAPWKGDPSVYSDSSPTPSFYVQSDQADARMEILASGGKRPMVSGHLLGGTLASPAATPQNADFLIRMNVFDGTNYLDSAATIDLHQDGSLASGNHSTSIRFNTTNSSGTSQEVMRLDHDGLVYAQEVLVTPQSAWPDYVFSSGYRLAPLSEVEQVIKTEKHLPGIPSAPEVAAHGVKTGEMEAELLAKVEELTLHLIDQEKSLTSQQILLARQQAFLASQQAEMTNQAARITQLERENQALRGNASLSATAP